MTTLRIFLFIACFSGAEHAFATVQTLQKDSTGQECVHIRLKNGEIILGKVSKMDEKVLEFKPCYQPDAPIQTVSLTELSQITSLSNKIIFNNEPKILSGALSKKEKSGIFVANLALGSTLTSVTSILLLTLLPKSATIAGAGFIFPIFTPLGNTLLLLVFVGILVGFLAGLISLSLLGRSGNKSARRKAFIALIPGLLILLLSIGS
jgi:hypothetical protein